MVCMQMLLHSSGPDAASVLVPAARQAALLSNAGDATQFDTESACCLAILFSCKLQVAHVCRPIACRHRAAASHLFETP